MIEYFKRKPVEYFCMASDDIIVHWESDGHILSAVYDPILHEITDEDELERMSRDIQKHYKNNIFSMEHICKMAGGAR